MDKISISPNYYFKLEDGKILKHVNELPEIIKDMDESMFKKYVTSDKNYFASWIKDVFRLHSLSNMIEETKSKEETVRILNAYMKSQQSNSIKKTVLPENVIMKAEASSTQTFQTNQSQKAKFAWKHQSEQKVVQQDIQLEKKETEITNSQEYFEKNPLIMSQFIDAKKRILEIEPLKQITYTGNEGFKELVELFKDNYTKIYDKMVFLRKSGFDTELIQVMLFRIPTKIKLYEASREDKDTIIIKRYLNEVIEELNSIKK